MDSPLLDQDACLLQRIDDFSVKQPFAYCCCRELGAIVGTNVIRWPVQQEQVRERLSNNHKIR